MDELRIPSTDLRQAAAEFAKASKESQEIVDRLEKASAQLEQKWAGVTQQLFYKHYKDWRLQMKAYAGFLKNIANELSAIADRFEKADG
jgi:WXG100 family type VII secretion target